MIKANYSNYNLATLGNLARVTIEHSKQNANDEITSNPLFVILVERYNRFDAALLRDYKTGLGKALEDADAERDNVYRGVCAMLKGSIAFGGERSIAAQRLLNIFDKHDAVPFMSYTQQSEVMHKILKDLDMPENKALFEIVGMEDHFEHLKSSQLAFDNLTVKKQDTLSDLRQMDSASNLRRELIEALRNYFSFVDMMRNNPPWKDIYEDLRQARITANNARKPKDNSEE